MTRTPSKDRPKRQLSEAELAQRRAASRKGAAAATGPRTPEGKARSSRNGWKHGLTSAVHRQHFDQGMAALMGSLARPCLSTCPKYPCYAVEEGMTRPGGSCMDKERYVHAFTAIIDAVENHAMDGVNALMASEIASTLQMLHDMKARVTDLGPVIGIQAIDSDGNAIYGKDGQPVIAKWVPNPGWPIVLKTLEVLGINLPELLATPQSKARAQVEDEKVDAVQQLMGGIFQRAAAARMPAGARPALEHDEDA
ncbi:hypothetical protein EIM50_13800 [Pseudoxanthomonas sp. SGD-10]|nr:hypothetical protein EIM50_13800 [Pseudoxanthomonas sp. SGD-10]